jgi:hypothetical protein
MVHLTSVEASKQETELQCVSSLDTAVNPNVIPLNITQSIL